MKTLALTLAAAIALAPAAFAQTAPSAPQGQGPQSGRPGMGMTERQNQRARSFDEMDANKDGKLTQQEMVDHAAARAREQFTRLDSDKDGSVTKDEFLARHPRGSVFHKDRPNRAGQPEGTR